MRGFFCLSLCLLSAGCDGPREEKKLDAVLPMRGKFNTYRLHQGNGTRLAVNKGNKVNCAIVGNQLPSLGVVDDAVSLQRITASHADILMPVLLGSIGINFLMKVYDFVSVIKVMAFGANEHYLYKMASAYLEGGVIALPFFSSMGSDVSKRFVDNYQQLNGMNSIPAYSSQSRHNIIHRLKYARAPAGLTP